MRVVFLLPLWGLVACAPDEAAAPVGFVNRRVDFVVDARRSLLAGNLRLQVPERYCTLPRSVSQ
jgi:hypothetical protein